MKRYLPIILLLLIALVLPSCVGIGDGALFDDIKTSKADGERVVCTLELYGSNKREKYDEAVFEGAEAEALCEYLLSAKEPYIEGIDDDLMGYNYMVASFECYDGDGNKIPSFDASTGEMLIFYVRDNDNVDQGNMLLGAGKSRLGYLEGAYDKLFGYITEKGSSQGIFCNMITSETPGAFVRASGWQARNIYLLLSELEYPSDTDIPRTDVEKPYVILGFWGTADAEYYVYSDDFVEQFNSEPYTNASLFKPLGFLDGIYEQAMQLYINALDIPTEAERNAGVKLNCLQVTVDDMPSRAYYVSDFADVGCTFLYAVDSHSYLIYFESCSEEKLQDKIAVLEQIEGIKEANVIPVILYGDEDTFYS